MRASRYGDWLGTLLFCFRWAERHKLETKFLVAIGCLLSNKACIIGIKLFGVQSCKGGSKWFEKEKSSNVKHTYSTLNSCCALEADQQWRTVLLRSLRTWPPLSTTTRITCKIHRMSAWNSANAEVNNTLIWMLYYAAIIALLLLCWTLFSCLGGSCVLHSVDCSVLLSSRHSRCLALLACVSKPGDNLYLIFRRCS